MFIVLGVLTIMVGIFTVVLMPDNPMSVTWLTEAEKRSAIERVAVNQTGIQNRHFKFSHLKELVFDLQIWLLTVITILVGAIFSRLDGLTWLFLAGLHELRNTRNLFRYPDT